MSETKEPIRFPDGMIVYCAHTRMVDVDALVPNPANENSHPPEQIALLAKIMKYNGVRNPITVSTRSGFMSKGHGRLLAAKLNGWKQFPVDDQFYENEAAEAADRIADNKIAELAEIDPLKLKETILKMPEGFDLELMGLTGLELKLADPEPGADEDEVPEPPAQPRSKPGELWLLGNHRLLCGDSTNKEDVTRLMAGEKADMVFTDPPYGMNLNTNHDELFQSDSSHVMKGNRFVAVEGDDKPYDPSPILGFTCQKFVWGCDYFYSRLPDGGSFVAWDKRNENLDAVPGNTAEFCWAHPPVRRTSVRLLWSGHHGMQKDDSKTRVHPTQKPTALAEWFFDRWGKDAKNIWDGYLGSGSTLIACEKTGRKCYGMEISPVYCDVTLDRFAKFSGKDPIRESDGKPWSQVRAT